MHALSLCLRKWAADFCQFILSQKTRVKSSLTSLFLLPLRRELFVTMQMATRLLHLLQIHAINYWRRNVIAPLIILKLSSVVFPGMRENSVTELGVKIFLYMWIWLQAVLWDFRTSLRRKKGMALKKHNNTIRWRHYYF